MDASAVLLRMNMVVAGDPSSQQTSPDDVARATLKVISQSARADVRGIAFLPPALSRGGAEFVVLPRDDLFEQLAHHETDVVLAGRPPRGSGLVTRARRSNKLIVVSAPGRYPAPRKATWLLRGPGSGTRDTTLGLLTQLDVSPPTLTLGTHGAVLAAAREGLGVTLVHADAVSHDLEIGTLEHRLLPRTPLNRPWHVATTDTPTRSATLFLTHITSRDEVGETAFHLHDRPAG